jgi:predicted RNase H-like HicB family nuclease
MLSSKLGAVASSTHKTHILPRLPLSGRNIVVNDNNPFMTYRVHLYQTEEGWAFSCPELPGCHSQGETREEALTNITEAIRLWLESKAEEEGVQRVEEAEITI